MLRRFSSMAADLGPIASSITKKIQEQLKPTSLKLLNDSKKHSKHTDQHAKHAGSAAANHGETHFRLKVVSEEFAGKPAVKRHQLVYGMLSDEFAAGLHALSMDLKTPAEVERDAAAKGAQ